VEEYQALAKAVILQAVKDACDSRGSKLRRERARAFLEDLPILVTKNGKKILEESSLELWSSILEKDKRVFRPGYDIMRIKSLLEDQRKIEQLWRGIMKKFGRMRKRGR